MIHLYFYRPLLIDTYTLYKGAVFYLLIFFYLPFLSMIITTIPFMTPLPPFVSVFFFNYFIAGKLNYTSALPPLHLRFTFALYPIYLGGKAEYTPATMLAARKFKKYIKKPFSAQNDSGHQEKKVSSIIKIHLLIKLYIHLNTFIVIKYVDKFFFEFL